LVAFYAIKKLIPVHSWITLAASAIVAAVIGYAIMLMLYGRPILRSVWEKIKK
jgi:hypothetical protein